MSGTHRFDRLRVVSPCTANWNEMTGTEQKRYCEQCDKHVFDFSKMSRSEAERITALRGYRLCARLSFNPDGTIQTQSSVVSDLITDSAVVKRRSSKLTTALAAGLLGLGAVGLTLPMLPAIAASDSTTEQPVKKKRNKETTGTTAELFGTIMHTDESPIAGASVTVTFTETGESLNTVSDVNGIYHFTSLQPGTYSLKVSAGQWLQNRIQAINLRPGMLKRKDVELREPVIGVTIISEPPLRELYRNSDLIVTARVGEIAIAEKNRAAKRKKITLSLTSVFKGEVQEQTIDVYTGGNAFEDASSSAFKTDAHLLLFLKERQPDSDGHSRNGYEISGWETGAREITDETLPVWKKQLEKLLQFEFQEAPPADEITEWMVQLIENPLTREDGVSDLLASVNYLKWMQKYQEREKAQCATGTCSDENNPTEGVDSFFSFEKRDWQTGQIRFALALTETQKSRIAAVFFGLEKITSQEISLLELVSNWNDPRFLPLVSSQLSTLLQKPESQQSYYAHRLLEIIVERTGDEGLAEMKKNYEAERYSISAQHYDEREKALKAKNEDSAGKNVKAGKDSDDVDDIEESDPETQTDPEEEKRQQELEAKLEAVRARFLKKFLPLLQQKVQAQAAGHLKSN